jgi:hypothetical protein
MMNHTRKNKQILSISADSKTVKGKTLGFLTGILYLIPDKELCPAAALAGCDKPCLVGAGRGKFTSVKNARIKKTLLFKQDKELFISYLIWSIATLERKAKRENLTPLVRLNGTSDVPYENLEFNYQGVHYKNIFQLFPHVQFYDYTKLGTRKNIPVNYDLTFSYSGLESFQPMVQKALNNPNMNRIAVVFRTIASIPLTFLDRKVLKGDNSDVRHIEPHGTIVALYAKGAAKTDYSGFVMG